MENSTIEKKADTAISEGNISTVCDDCFGSVIEKMTKQVDEKLLSLRSFSPLILTIVTSMIAYIVTQNFTDDLLWFGVVLVGYSLICLALIFLAFYPKKHYLSDAPKKVNRLCVIFKLRTEFVPWNLASYIGLSDDEFIMKLQNYFSKELTIEEKIHANFLKQKTNEYSYKRRQLSLSYIIIIVGAVILGVACIFISLAYTI